MSNTMKKKKNYVKLPVPWITLHWNRLLQLLVYSKFRPTREPHKNVRATRNITGCRRSYLYQHRPLLTFTIEANFTWQFKMTGLSYFSLKGGDWITLRCRHQDCALNHSKGFLFGSIMAYLLLLCIVASPYTWHFREKRRLWQREELS